MGRVDGRGLGGGPDPVGSMARFMTEVVDVLLENGYTLRRSGVIYDHDPGDEHVEPSRWASASDRKQRRTRGV